MNPSLTVSDTTHFRIFGCPCTGNGTAGTSLAPVEHAGDAGCFLATLPAPARGSLGEEEATSHAVGSEHVCALLPLRPHRHVDAAQAEALSESSDRGIHLATVAFHQAITLLEADQQWGTVFLYRHDSARPRTVVLRHDLRPPVGATNLADR